MRRALDLLVLGMGAAACGGGGDASAGDADGGAAVVSSSSGAPDAATASGDAAEAGAPAPTCDARAFGAKGDGQTKDTSAIQAAIDACAGKGGVVVLRGGTFLSGMIVLKSAVTLSIEKDAVLKGTQDDADYPSTSPPTSNTQLSNCRKALVYAESAHDVAIRGGGTIDGNGDVAKWIGPSHVHPEATRPMAIYTALSQNVTIEDVRVENAAMWGVVNLEVDHLVIRNVVVDSTLSGNRDGIDVVDGHHVLIEGCTITSEDDSNCLKSGSARGVDDVVVRNCHVVRSIVANGLKFGTASYGPLTNVTFEDIVVDDVDKAAMAVESVDGADVKGVTFRNITVKGAGSPFFVLLGDRGTTPAGAPRKVGTIDDVRFEHVAVTGVKYQWSSPISGTRLADGSLHRLGAIVFDDVRVVGKGGMTSVPADPPEYAGQYPDPNLWGDLPAYGYFVRHAESVTFRDTVTTPSATDVRSARVARDVGTLLVTP